MLTAHSTRTLHWPACYNVRDLGGLPTVDGCVTRWRAIIRSDIPSRLTPAGQQALLDYGVRTILDLRERDQVRAEPSIFMECTGDAALPTYVNLPMETREPAVSALIRAAHDRSEVYQIILDHYPVQIAAILRAIGTASAGGVLIHCHAGKDRTGIIVALLLGLAGVPDAMIAADYAESQVCLWPLWEKLVEAAGGEEKADLSLKPMATTAMMDRLLAHLTQRYGGIHGYLAWIGLRDQEMARLRERLCT